MKPQLTYPLTPQMAFNYIWHHFIVEKNPKAMWEYQCVYDTPQGGCAVGCVLPADLRARIGHASFRMLHVIGVVQGRGAFKGSADQAVASRFAGRLEKLLGRSNLAFFASMQDAHDDSDDSTASEELASMAHNFRGVADKYSLTVPQTS